MSPADVSGANLDTKTIFMAGAIGNGLSLTCRVCAIKLKEAALDALT